MSGDRVPRFFLYIGQVGTACPPKFSAMKKIALFLLLLACALGVSAGTKKKAEKDTNHFRYELECAGNAAQGMYLVKVWSYSRKAAVAAEQCKKNAVHGIIFKGYSGANGCVAQRPLAANPGVEAEYADFFDAFFKDGGEYQKYVSTVSGTQEVLKVGKEYKVGVVVSVSKDALRKALEAAGVVKSLNYGF